MTAVPSLDSLADNPGFVPRPDQYAEVQNHFRATHSLEAERRRGELLRVYGGWGLAGVFGLFALVQGLRDINRPVPHDRFEIAILHEDGSYSAPVEVKDLTPVQQREVLQTSLFNYIAHRAGYAYASSQHDYNVVSAMTAGTEQARYQRVMLSKDQANPMVRLGLKGQIVPMDIRLEPDPTGPNSWNFTYTQRVINGDAPPQDTPMRGSLTFVRGPVLSKFRVPYDPAGILVLQYEDHPAEGAPR
jgi:type IV secretory pathway component VirB8